MGELNTTTLITLKNGKVIDIKKALSLNNQKLPMKEIARIMGVNRHTLRKYLRKMGLKLKKYNPSKRIKPKLEPSPTLAYLLGALKGDGSALLFKNGRGFISLTVKDEVFARKVYETMKAIGLRPRLKKHEKKKMWEARAFSISFVEWYKSLSYQDICDIAKKYPLDFLRGFYEAEGTAYKVKNTIHIRIANKDLQLIKICEKLLRQLGYQCSLYRRRKGNHYWYDLYVLGSSSEKVKLLELLNPCIKRVM